jgi:hypothetical protein
VFREETVNDYKILVREYEERHLGYRDVYWSWNSSVCEVTGCELDSWGLILGRNKDFCACHDIQTNCGTC